MKLFISYARIDKPYCIQIVETLDAHETWFDQRLKAGQNWWKEILRRLDWCEGFIYLLSPDSVASEYCQKEFELARKLGRHILPVLIHKDTKLPASLRGLHYADLSNGLTAPAVKALLNSLYLVANDRMPIPVSVDSMTSEAVSPPLPKPVSAITAATHAMEDGQFDNAVFLLKRAKAAGYSSKFIKIDAVLAEAEAGLRRQAYLREASREYDQIAGLIKLERTRRLGCEAFQAFQEQFTDYDPENMAKLCGEPEKKLDALIVGNPQDQSRDVRLPQIEWCVIPAGERKRFGSTSEKQAIKLPAFKIGKFPVTNAQYNVFLNDPSGYADPSWWKFSKLAEAWRDDHPEPKTSTFKGDERPAEMLSWYDANAFCHWLSDQSEQKVMLPTDDQWVRAAVGDEDWLFPWGNTYDRSFCNTRESEIKMTTLVMRYEEGVSPFGVYDMAGNVWEWCVDEENNKESGDEQKRLIHGGSFVSPSPRAQVQFKYFLAPNSFHSTIGFRLVTNVDDKE